MPPTDPATYRAAPQSTALSRGAIAVAMLAAALPGVLTGLRMNADLFGRGLLNPDSAMRLVRLEDIVAAQAPLHAVMRDASGTGNVLPWSHLLDSLLLLLATPLRLLMGWPEALHGAALTFGPLSMAALGVAIVWTAAPVASRSWLWIGAFAAGAAPSLGGYGMLGEVHHHVPVAVAAVMAAGWALRLLRGHAALPGGIALGAWAACGLWFSPEAAPFAILAMGALWVAWMAGPDQRLTTGLLAAGATMAGLAALIVAVDSPSGGLAAVEPDRISLPWVALAAGAAMVAATARATGRRVPTLLAGLLLGILWLAAFPAFLRGTEGLMTAAEAEAFFGPITEMQPVRGLNEVMEFLAGGLFAVVALAVWAWRCRRGPGALPLAYTALCLAGTLALASLHIRFSTYPAVAGAILLPVALGAISASTLPHALQSMGRLALIALLLGASHLAPMAASARPQTTAMPCSIAGAAALLHDHAGAVVLAGVNETPDLLYRTGVVTVGSLYHRNPQGYMRLRAAWRSIPGNSAPPPELTATGATLVLGCPNEPRWLLVDGLPQTTLLDRLVAADPPAWLHRIADAGPGGYILYEVAP